MASINSRPKSQPKFNHEGTRAYAAPTALLDLRRAVMSCLLWEKQFYESGEDIAERIRALVGKCDRHAVALLASEARTDFNLRHVPLLLIAAMVEHGMSPSRIHVKSVIQRADEMGELLAILWRNGKRPIPKQVKLGIADAFKSFSEYNLAKYKNGAISMLDVMRIVHPKPDNEAQQGIFERISEGVLETPNTWETRLSGGENKGVVFTDLIQTQQLGSLALLRNLRNMEQAGVDRSLVNNALRTVNHRRTLPFRFIAASRHAPAFAAALNDALLAKVGEMPAFGGRTIVLVDVSGSMNTSLSAKSDMTRMDAACGLASIFPGQDVRVFSFSNDVIEVPAYRGLPGVDAIRRSQYNSSTYLGRAVTRMNEIGYDRLIVITDEQSHDRVPAPLAGSKAYMINVASARNGVSYSDWTKIDGFSESVIRFMQEIEG